MNKETKLKILDEMGKNYMAIYQIRTTNPTLFNWLQIESRKYYQQKELAKRTGFKRFLYWLNIKRKRTDNYLFTVKSNSFGRFLINLLKIFGLTLRLRGRHSHRKQLFVKINHSYYAHTQNDVPIKHAERLAVYLGGENGRS